MATITLQRAYGNTITQALTAFGPTKTQAYDSLTVSTVQTAVSAFVTGYTFKNVHAPDDKGTMWLIAANAFGTLPVKVANAGVTFGGLSATVGTCAKGPYAATLTVTLSNFALSGASSSAVFVDTQTQTLTFPITAVNTAFINKKCHRRLRRQRRQGQV